MDFRLGKCSLVPVTFEEILQTSHLYVWSVEKLIATRKTNVPMKTLAESSYKRIGFMHANWKEGRKEGRKEVFSPSFQMLKMGTSELSGKPNKTGDDGQESRPGRS